MLNDSSTFVYGEQKRWINITAGSTKFRVKSADGSDVDTECRYQMHNITKESCHIDALMSFIRSEGS